jgi:hypothetical protein
MPSRPGFCGNWTPKGGHGDLDRIGQPKQSTAGAPRASHRKARAHLAQDAQTARRTLMAAGYRAESAVALLYGIKLILAVTAGHPVDRIPG